VAALLLLDLGQALDRPALHGDRGRVSLRRWGCRQGQAWSRNPKKTTAGWAGWRHGVLLPQLQLLGQTHGSREGLWIEDLHVEAERWSKTAREQLHLLLLVERAGASQERLKMVLVLRDGGGAVAVRELGEWGSMQGRPVA
jgi:hypothetical protein